MTASNEWINAIAAACIRQLRRLPAARRDRGRRSVSKVRIENGGHGCRRLYGWDSKDAGLVAIGTRADTTNALSISNNQCAALLLQFIATAKPRAIRPSER